MCHPDRCWAAVLLGTSLLLGAGALACGGEETIDNPDVPLGATAVVVVMNPVENEGNTEGLPAFFSDILEDVDVAADPGGAAVTDVTGLAVLGDLAPGPLDLIFDAGPTLPLDIAAEGDVYDAAVAYDGDQAEYYPGFPIRYPVGGTVVEVAVDEDAAVALDTDSTLVLFNRGVHRGDLVIEGDDVVLFGAGFSERAVVIDGNVEVRGTGVRLRGVTITGSLQVLGNDFGMSFSVVEGAADFRGNAIAFLRNVFCQGATVPSSNAALYDNAGLAPIPAPAEVCEPEK